MKSSINFAQNTSVQTTHIARQSVYSCRQQSYRIKLKTKQTNKQKTIWPKKLSMGNKNDNHGFVRRIGSQSLYCCRRSTQVGRSHSQQKTNDLSSLYFYNLYLCTIYISLSWTWCKLSSFGVCCVFCLPLPCPCLETRPRLGGSLPYFSWVLIEIEFQFHCLLTRWT